MFGKKLFKKALSAFLCMAMIFTVMSGFSFAVSAADYNWGANWRYKTEEGGEWHYPASGEDVFTHYDGNGYFWADFDGDNPDCNFNIGSAHAGMEVKAGSTLIITASSFYNNDPDLPHVEDEAKLWCNITSSWNNNLMQTKGGTIIIGEGIWLEQSGGKSAISLENGKDSACYVAGRVTGSSGGWLGAGAAQGVWTNTGGAFHRLGRDNDYKNDGSGDNAMVITDYYKGYINAGDHITSVDEGDYLFKGREFEPYLAQGDHYYLSGADHEISCTVETGYHFISWTGDETYDTQTADMKFNVTLTSDANDSKRTITANAEINKYTVTFVSGATGGTLKTQTEVPYGSAAAAPTPANIVDVNNDATHKVFDRWNTAFDNVTDNLTVTALYNDVSHNNTITSHNSSGHTLYCEACGHVKEGAAHSFNSYTGLCECGYESPEKADYTAVDNAIASAPRILVYYTDASVAAYDAAVAAVERSLYVGRQSDVNTMAANISAAVEGLTVKSYNISVNGENCSVSQSLPADSHYYLATIRAPKTNSAGDYFTYWQDNEGNVVGTYRNYSFYAVKDASFTPVFTPRADYEEARKDAVIASRVLDAKINRDGTVILYGEHSVSSTEESINGHGLLATTDSSLANASSLVVGSSDEKILDFMANSSSANLTGLVETQAALTGSAVWARTYVIDKNGDVKYGDITSFPILSAVTDSSGGEAIIIDSESLDLTAQNETGDSPAAVEEPADMFALITDMLKNILASVINYIKLALSILK